MRFEHFRDDVALSSSRPFSYQCFALSSIVVVLTTCLGSPRMPVGSGVQRIASLGVHNSAATCPEHSDYVEAFSERDCKRSRTSTMAGARSVW